MKYRYVVKRNMDRKGLVIREFAKRDDDHLEFTGAATFHEEAMLAALPRGVAGVMAAFRSDRMFPPACVAKPLAEAVIRLYGPGSPESLEDFVEEIDVKPSEARVVAAPAVETEEEGDLLEEEFEEEMVDADDIRKVTVDIDADVQVETEDLEEEEL
jgi:hypothetical protein